MVKMAEQAKRNLHFCFVILSISIFMTSRDMHLLVAAILYYKLDLNFPGLILLVLFSSKNTNQIAAFITKIKYSVDVKVVVFEQNRRNIYDTFNVKKSQTKYMVLCLHSCRSCYFNRSATGANTYNSCKIDYSVENKLSVLKRKFNLDWMKCLHQQK